MTNIAQRLLENVKQHMRARAVETKQARQAPLMVDVARHVERRCVARVEDQLQGGQHMALRDLRHPLADP
jgi:hypothetical protein